ncbi:MAG: hypothetical protein AAGI11_22390, partial [Pseudomonadota bacterium]
MNNILDILTAAGRKLDLAEDIEALDALGELTEAWKRYREAANELNAMSAVAFIEGPRDDEELYAAVEDVGIEAERLRALATRLARLLGRIPEPARKLLTPVSYYANGGPDGLIDWDILDKSLGGSGGTDTTYSFELGATASLELDAAEDWPGSGDAPGTELVILDFEGSLQGKAGASMPFKAGSVSANTAASAELGLRYFFDPEDDDTLYARAVAKGLRHLSNPFSLDSVWHAMNRGTLAGVIARIKGESSLAVEVGVANGFDLAEDITVDAGLTVGVDVGINADYDITITRETFPGGAMSGIKVAIERTRSTERGISAALGVEVNLEKLVARLRTILERHEGQLKDVLDDYREFLTPGTYIQDKLENELKDAVKRLVDESDHRDILKQAIEVGLGSSSGGTPAALRKDLNALITGRIDSLADPISSRASDAAASALAKLGLENTDIGGKAQEELAELLKEYQKQLEEKVTGLSSGPLNKLIGKLEEAGVAMANNVTKANQALSGVKAAIEQYETMLGKLITATQDAARHKVIAKFEMEDRREQGALVEATAVIDQLTPATEDAYDALVTGRFEKVMALLERSPPGLTFDEDSTFLTRFRKASKKFGYQLVIVGFEFSSIAMFDSEARVTVDGAGRVSAISKGTWIRITETDAEKRRLVFFNVLDIAAGLARGELEIGLTLDHQDAKLTQGDVTGFVESLAEAGLLPTTTINLAQNTLRRWATETGSERVKGDISLSLMLDDKESRRIFRQVDRQGGGLSEETSFKLFSLAYNNLIESAEFPEDLLEEIEDRMPRRRSDENISLLRRFFELNSSSDIASLNRSPRNMSSAQRAFHRKIIDARALYELCNGYVQFLDTIGDAYELHQLPGLSPEELEDRYDQLQL